MGFEIPLARLLRGPLKYWVESLLDKNILKHYDFLNCNEIIKMWNIHKSGERNYHYHLWSTLMFLSWIDAQIFLP